MKTLNAKQITVTVNGCVHCPHCDGPQDSLDEYRMFIVNGQVVSSTKYRLRTILDKKPNAPSEIVDFANRMAAIWSPEKAYVMDVCKTDQGELKLLELNCFNASGVYAAPIEPIIEAVEFFYPHCHE